MTRHKLAVAVLALFAQAVSCRTLSTTGTGCGNSTCGSEQICCLTDCGGSVSCTESCPSLSCAGDGGAGPSGDGGTVMTGKACGSSTCGPGLVCCTGCSGTKSCAQSCPDLFCPATDSGTSSPGNVTLKLEITSPTTYCQQAECGPGSAITIKDSAGRVVNRAVGFASCNSDCETCLPPQCPGFACQARGYAVTGEALSWDGTYFAAGTCGAGMQCTNHLYAKPGSYTAVMCAIPGALASDTNGTPTCTATGPVKCVEVPFQFPSSDPAIGKL